MRRCAGDEVLTVLVVMRRRLLTQAGRLKRTLL